VEGFPTIQIPKDYPNFPKKNCFDLLNFICKIYSIFNILSTICPSITKSPQCTPYSLRDFQQHQGHGGGYHGLGDLNITNKINKLPFLEID